MKEQTDSKQFLQVVTKLVSEQKYGEAINYLQRIIDEDQKNEGAKAYLQQIKKINEYQTRDIYGTTNLNMDPWLE
ncbi:MAG: hypothetical protein ACLFNU_09455 [Bacteroidales bacterium]